MHEHHLISGKMDLNNIPAFHQSAEQHFTQSQAIAKYAAVRARGNYPYLYPTDPVTCVAQEKKIPCFGPHHTRNFLPLFDETVSEIYLPPFQNFPGSFVV